MSLARLLRCPFGRRLWFVLFALFVACFAGCSRGTDDPEVVVLQTDWLAQPEHGGFYQALAKGYYAEAGLEVTILQGGPNAMTSAKVLRGRAHFAMNRADTLLRMMDQGMPFQMVMATLQSDAQGILLHASNPIESLAELDGATIMATPGLAWTDYVQARYDIEFSIIPHDYGMERFLADPHFIQQCLVTNEPFYAQLRGAEVKVLPVSDAGFDPYHVVYARADYLAAQPEVAQRFIEASIRGWEDYITGDPQPALDLIQEANPRMTPDFMAYSYNTLRRLNLVTGRPERGDAVGKLDSARIEGLQSELLKLGILEEAVAAPVWTPPADAR